MEHTLDICLYSHRVWTLSLSCPQSPSIAGQTSCQRHRPGSWTTQLIGQGHATGCILCQRRLCKWTQNASWLCRWNLYPSGSSAVLCFTKSLEECVMLIAVRPRNFQTFIQVLYFPQKGSESQNYDSWMKETHFACFSFLWNSTYLKMEIVQLQAGTTCGAFSQRIWPRVIFS